MNCQTKTDKVSNFRITNSWELCKGKGENGSDVIASKKRSIQTRADILLVNASNVKKEKGAREKIHITKSDKAWHMKKP
jgi:hypothetical protein